MNRSTPEPRSVRCGDRLRAVLQGLSPRVRRSAAPDRLAAIRPQVEKRLTAVLQLRSLRAHPSFIKEETRSAGRRRCPIAAYSAEKRAGEEISDAPCRAPLARPETRTRSAENQDRFHRSHVNEEQLSRPRAPFIDKCSFMRPLSRTGARHRSRGFATAEPASDAHSPLRCSRTEGLDPARLHRLITRGRKDRAPLVNFCNRLRSASTTRAIDRALHTAPGSPPKAACLQVAGPLSKHSQPRFHRPEAGLAKAMTGVLPSRSLAAEACPQPDRLGHLLSQARFNGGWRSLR